MKKIYIQPSMFAVTLQHQNHLAVTSIDGGDTDMHGGGEAAEGTHADVKGASIGNGKNIWDEEW